MYVSDVGSQKTEIQFFENSLSSHARAALALVETAPPFPDTRKEMVGRREMQSCTDACALGVHVRRAYLQ